MLQNLHSNVTGLKINCTHSGKTERRQNNKSSTSWLYIINDTWLFSTSSGTRI